MEKGNVTLDEKFQNRNVVEQLCNVWARLLKMLQFEPLKSFEILMIEVQTTMFIFL